MRSSSNWNPLKKKKNNGVVLAFCSCFVVSSYTLVSSMFHCFAHPFSLHAPSRRKARKQPLCKALYRGTTGHAVPNTNSTHKCPFFNLKDYTYKNYKQSTKYHDSSDTSVGPGKSGQENRQHHWNWRNARSNSCIDLVFLKLSKAESWGEKGGEFVFAASLLFRTR